MKYGRLSGYGQQLNVDSMSGELSLELVIVEPNAISLDLLASRQSQELRASEAHLYRQLRPDLGQPNVPAGHSGRIPFRFHVDHSRYGGRIYPIFGGYIVECCEYLCFIS